jgi:hypothetical protein
LPGPKGDSVPAFIEWDPSLNALGVVSALIDNKQVLPVVRTFIAFPIFSDTYFPLGLSVSTEIILGQSQVMPRTFCGLWSRDWHFPFLFLTLSLLFHLSFLPFLQVFLNE